MLYAFRKRITRIPIANTTETAQEVLAVSKDTKYDEKNETLISDSFFIENQEDGKGIILAKEKVIYDGVGKSFTYDK